MSVRVHDCEPDISMDCDACGKYIDYEFDEVYCEECNGKLKDSNVIQMVFTCGCKLRMGSNTEYWIRCCTGICQTENFPEFNFQIIPLDEHPNPKLSLIDKGKEKTQ